MDDDVIESVNDVLFMKNLGVSEENIALLKRMSLQDVKDIINAKKDNSVKQKKKNIIQDIANSNQWKESPPSPKNAKKIGENAWKENEINLDGYYETMTKPSKHIAKTDRSDRTGEDVNLKIDNSDKTINNINERLEQKRKWKELVDDILDDV